MPRANMVYLMEAAKSFAGKHPQREALRTWSAAGDARNKAGGGGGSPDVAFSHPPIAARHLGRKSHQRGEREGKSGRSITQNITRRVWVAASDSRNAMELKIPATKQTISPYYLMKGCQFIQIGSGTEVGLYSLGGSFLIGNKQILSFNDVISNCDYRIRMKAGDSFFRAHDFKLSIKITFKNELRPSQRMNLNLSEDRNAFLGWITNMYSRNKAMGYNYSPLSMEGGGAIYTPAANE